MSSQPDDFIEQLGALVLDHRFKRMSRRLLQGAETLYAEAGLTFRARWVSTYRLLDAEPWLPVGEIAVRLGLSHPAVIQLAAEMKGQGMLSSRPDPNDGRRRLLALSDAAMAMRPRLNGLWDALAREQQELFARSGVDILTALESVTAALDRRSLVERVLETPLTDNHQLPNPGTET